MYHIGPGFPHPQPYKKNYQDGIGWKRRFKDFRIDEKVVFLTPDFTRVWNNHGRNGNVYIFEVPQWVIKESGGVNSYDYALELIVPEHLWQDVTFKGSMDEGRAKEIVEKRSRPFPTNQKKIEIPPVSIGSVVHWMKSVEHGYKRESLFRVTDIKKDRAQITYLGELSWKWEYGNNYTKYEHKMKLTKPWDFKGSGIEEASLLHLTVDTKAEEEIAKSPPKV